MRRFADRLKFSCVLIGHHPHSLIGYTATMSNSRLQPHYPCLPYSWTNSRQFFKQKTPVVVFQFHELPTFECQKPLWKSDWNCNIFPLQRLIVKAPWCYTRLLPTQWLIMNLKDTEYPEEFLMGCKRVHFCQRAWIQSGFMVWRSKVCSNGFSDALGCLWWSSSGWPSNTHFQVGNLFAGSIGSLLL